MTRVDTTGCPDLPEDVPQEKIEIVVSAHCKVDLPECGKLINSSIAASDPDPNS